LRRWFVVVLGIFILVGTLYLQCVVAVTLS
jgi:hypothetical protein